jgi:hypothetical protein
LIEAKSTTMEFGERHEPEKKIKLRRSRQRVVEFNLAREVHYIQRRAAERDGRFVTTGQLAFFSCERRDAWMLDPSDRLATPLARDGDLSQSSSMNQRPPTPSAGKVTTISMAAHSFTPIKRPVASLQSSPTSPLRRRRQLAAVPAVGDTGTC